MNKQQGSVHAIIIGVLSVALVGTIGLLFWQNFVRSDASGKTTTEMTEAASSKQAVNKDEEKATLANANEGYLVLDSWDVRFKPTGSAKISYKQNDYSYWFTTDKWKNLGGMCDTNGGATLMRMTEKSTQLASPPIPLHNEEKIGDYYYYYSGPQDQCSDDPYALEKPEYQIIKDLLSTIEAKK